MNLRIGTAQPMAIEAKTVLGVERFRVVADKWIVERARCGPVREATSPLLRSLRRANKALGLFTKDDFPYDGQRDVYMSCGRGAHLPSRSREKGRDIRYYRNVRLRRCPLRVAMHKDTKSRRISRSAQGHGLEEMNARVAANPAIMARAKPSLSIRRHDQRR